MEVIESCSATNGGCMHKCSEEDERITCSCHTGYQLEADGRSCTGQHTIINV